MFFNELCFNCKIIFYSCQFAKLFSLYVYIVSFRRKYIRTGKDLTMQCTGNLYKGIDTSHVRKEKERKTQTSTHKAHSVPPSTPPETPTLKAELVLPL